VGLDAGRDAFSPRAGAIPKQVEAPTTLIGVHRGSPSSHLEGLASRLDCANADTLVPSERIEDMRFEKSIEIDAPQQRVWDVLSALDDWPQCIETVDTVELLTPGPITTGSRVRLKQPKLP